MLKNKIDKKWEKLREEFDYSTCQLWRVLTKEEKNYILDNYKEELYMLSNKDAAHIKGRGSSIELKYDKDNVVIICRYFHTLLDTYRDPVTKKEITDEQRGFWFERIKAYKEPNPYFRNRRNK